MILTIPHFLEYYTLFYVTFTSVFTLDINFISSYVRLIDKPLILLPNSKILSSLHVSLYTPPTSSPLAHPAVH